MSMKIKKGDTVKVIAGKDKDKTGKVVSVDVKNNRVVVEGVNMITKHEKPSMSNQQGGIVNKEAPYRCIQRNAGCKRSSDPRWNQS